MDTLSIPAGNSRAIHRAQIAKTRRAAGYPPNCYYAPLPKGKGYALVHIWYKWPRRNYLADAFGGEA